MTLTRANQMVIDEGLGSLETLISRIEELWAIRPPIQPAPEGSIVSDGRLPALIASICHEIGIASLCLFSRGRLEARFDNNARVERAAFIDKKLHGIDLGALADRTVRNRLMHIDEWLPRAFRHDLGAPALQDLAITRRSMFARADGNGEVVLIRVYVMEEDCIAHLGADLQLAAVHRAAKDALRALRQ